MNQFFLLASFEPISQEDEMNSYLTSRKNRLITVLQLVLAMALAGSSVVAGKILVSSMPVFLSTFFTLLVALLCLLPFMRGKMAEVKQLSGRQWVYLFLQGLCGIVLFRVFTLYGLKYTGALQAGVITGTTPAVLAALSFYMLKEPISRGSAVGVACALAGCILVNQGGTDHVSTHYLLGGMLVMLAVISESLFTIFRKRIADSVSAIVNTTVLIFCSLVILLIPATIEGIHYARVPGFHDILVILYYGVFATVIAYLLWTSAVGQVDGATAGAATAAMPASAVLLAALLLNEPLGLKHFGGFMLVVAGILTTSCWPAAQSLNSVIKPNSDDRIPESPRVLTK